MNSFKDAEVFLTVPTGGFIISLRVITVTVLMFLEIIMTATVVVSIVIDVSHFLI